MNTEQLAFIKKHGLTKDQFYGRSEYGGYLDLRSLTSIPEGFNPTVGDSLYLSSLTSIPEGFNPTVGGSLYLSSLTSIPEGFNPTVGGSLYLRSLTSIPEGFNPTVGGYLDLRSLTSIPEGFNPTVGGYLDLRSLTSIPEGFNPTVGGYLDLRSLTSIPEGFNPTVGGSLYLSSLTSIPEGFNPTVGGYLDLRSGLNAPTTPAPQLLSWQDGKYISVDGIFCEVIHKRGNVWKVKTVNKRNVFYIVSDGSGKYAHGDTIKDARSSLAYKLNEDASIENYKSLTLDSSMKFEDAIQCYRVITRACEFGVKSFVSEQGIKARLYTIREMIALTKGRYGSADFERFFADKA